MAGFKKSQFNVSTDDDDGCLLLLNTLSGSLLRFSETEAREVRLWLADQSSNLGRNLQSELLRCGFMVPESLDEHRRAAMLHEMPFKDRTRRHLIIMPTEKCNFRCVYCYEKFEKGRMKPSLQAGLKKYIFDNLNDVRQLSVSWFGGEPLVARDIVLEMSEDIKMQCERLDVRFRSDMTTNGYMLDLDTAEKLISAGVTSFQITLDGDSIDHDESRPLANGGKTFDRIRKNLLDLRDSELEFHVRLRNNFSPQTLPRAPEFIEFLSFEFSEDPRFSLHFHSVGKWGGPNDDEIDVCSSSAATAAEFDLMKIASESGFSLDPWRGSLALSGSTCYAADPNSLVIGSDGTIYKCTVAFDDERNQVGMLNEEGTISLDYSKVDLWTRSGEETDGGCQSCAFRPTCQGNVCPWERMINDQKTCVPFKFDGGARLRLLAKYP